MNERKRPTAIVADDEPNLRAQLIEALAALWPELEIVGEASHGEQAVNLVAGRRPDIAFLDIEMAGLSGLEAAAQIKGLTHVVFITAYERYALQAFEHAAIDYVLKPASEPRLREAVGRLKARLHGDAPADHVVHAALLRLAAEIGRPDAVRLRWIQASIGAQIRLVPVEDVLFFQSDLKYTRVVTRDGESLIRKPLAELLDELDPERFWQVHRSTIVNSAAIAHVVRNDDRLTIHLKHGSENLDVSRTYAHRFKSM